MNDKVNYFVTVKGGLDDEYRHLVRINGKLVVFKFNKNNVLKHVEHSDIYNFANNLTPIKFLDWFENSPKSELVLGMYESFDSKKLSDDYYYNLYNLDLRHKKLWNKFNTTLNVLKNEIKENDTVLLFNKEI